MRDRRREGSDETAILACQASQLVTKLGIGESTAREWRRLGRIPQAWLRAVRAVILGDVGILDERFHGWRVEGGRLCAPENGDYTFTPEDLYWIPYAREIIARLETERGARSIVDRDHGPMLPDPRCEQMDWIDEEFKQLSRPDHPFATYLRAKADFIERFPRWRHA